MTRIAAGILIVVLTGCAGTPANQRLSESVAVELTDTPFFAQERYQCGPAALATVLVANGIETTPEALVGRVYLPARQGSLQLEMTSATRDAGLIPYPINGSIGSLADELAAGRPVLVLQNLGVSWWPRWHYAVVVGLDGGRDDVLLRSGTDQRRRTRTAVFRRTWQRSDYWGIVALEPGELPADPDPDQYFTAVAEFEQVAQPADARRAWLAALARWPRRATPAFGLANLALAGQQNAEALRWYDRALQREPDHLLAMNNKAYALVRLGRQQEAMALLRRARTLADGPAATIIEESLVELESAGGG